MLKKYAPFLVLGPLSNALWAWWALPEINEQGTLAETLEWLAVQAFLPVLFAVLLFLKKKFVFWMLFVYSGFIILYGVGILGWALMGLSVPVSIYAVCLVLFVMGFGLLSHSVKDLQLAKKERKYVTEDE